MSESVVIVAAKRSAIGKFGGALSALSAVECGAQLLASLLNDLNLKEQVDQLIVGNVLSAGLGQNVARQVAMKSGLSQSVPAFTVNQVCGSGLQSVMLAAQAIRCGDADCVIAGGVESMSNAPFVMNNHRWGQKMGSDTIVDTMVHDGLWDAFNDYHMGITAENVAKHYNISRDEQDAFALASQEKASKAQKEGRFKDEIQAIRIKNRKAEILFSEDEFIRHDASLEALNALRPVFDKEGSVTAGNASGINDGAAFVCVMSASKASELGLEPLAVVSHASMAANDPAMMGVAPILAIQKLLDAAQLSSSDIDLFEINEAFASQSIAIQKELGLDSATINVNGGAIALGHPIGASGTRILVTLIHEMNNAQASRAIASLCIGGGQANALLLER